MIAEALAGKRIAVTGATGFLGTALVERLLRSVPGCELVLLVRPGQRSTVAQRAKREIFRNDAFDRLRARARRRRRSTAEVDRRVQVVAGDVGTDGLGLDDAGRGVARRRATSSSTRPPRCLRLAPRQRRRGQPARAQPHRRRPSHELGVDAPPRRRVDLLRRRQPPGRGPRGAGRREPVLRRRRLAGRGRRRPPRAGPTPRPRAARPRRWPSSARRPARELGAAGTPLLAEKTEQLRARRGSTDRMVEAGRARAALARLARRLRLHQGARRAGAARDPGRRAGDDRAARRSSSRRWPSPGPGWIRGFRMAEPVIISYARGLLKEFPGVPEGIVDVIPVDLVVGRHLRRRRPRAREPTSPTIIQVASGSANPLRYRRLVDLVQGWFTEHPLYDSEGQPIVVPRVVVPRAGAGSGPARAGQDDARARPRRSLHAAAAAGQAGRVVGPLEEQREQAERALGYVELYGAYAECEAIYGVDRLLALLGRARRRRPARRSASTRGSSTGPLRARRSTCRRSSSTPGSARRRGGRTASRPRRPAAPPGARPPTATSPPSTSRTRSSPRTSWRRTRGWPPGGCPPTTGCASSPRRCAEAPGAAGARPARPQRLPAPLLPALRGRPGRPDRRGRRRDVQRPDPHQVVPGRHPPGARAPRASATARVLITGALDFVVEPLRPAVRRHRVRPRSTPAPTARYTGELTDGAAHRRGPGPGAGRLRRRRGLRPGRGGRLRRLGQRPADARGGRLPGGGEPRDPPGRHRPQAGLAGRALGEGARRAPPAAARSAARPRRACTVGYRCPSATSAEAGR